MKSSSRVAAQSRAFRKLVEVISGIPACARSQILEMSLTDCEDPDITTQRILRAIRKELRMLIGEAQSPQLPVEGHELADTQNNIEVAFTLDHIFRQWLAKEESNVARPT